VVDAARDAHADAGVAIDTRVVEGDAVRALIDTARDGGYDLLVVGNKGMTGVSRFFNLGSVPNKLTHPLPCNLLIVKTTRGGTPPAGARCGTRALLGAAVVALAV